MPGNGGLKYLFGVRYRNQSEFFQSPDDISAQDPARSAFFDVDLEEVELFQLEGEGHKYLVDLRDGHFEIDGVPIFVGSPDENGLPTTRRLQFFRRHWHSFDVAQRKETTHEIAYFLGWKGRDAAGAEIERMIAVY